MPTSQTLCSFYPTIHNPTLWSDLRVFGPDTRSRARVGHPFELHILHSDFLYFGLEVDDSDGCIFFVLDVRLFRLLTGMIDLGYQSAKLI